MLKDFYHTSPMDVEPGDEFLVVLKAMVQYDGSVRLYRCRYEHGDDPQGSHVPPTEALEKGITTAVLPVLTGRRLT